MKRILLTIALLLLSAPLMAADTYKPFVLASNAAGKLTDQLSTTRTALNQNGFRVVGEYAPYSNAHVIIITNDQLLAAAAKGDRAAYIAVQRVSLTEVDGKVQVAYTNPVYLQHAYHVKTDLKPVADKLASALGNQQQFGDKKGMTARDLKRYHYAFGMEYFDDPYELNEFPNQAKAKAVLEKNLSAGVAGISKVYSLDIPGTKATLYGVTLNPPEGKNKYLDEAFQMGEVDVNPLRHTAYLPYEVLVNDGEIEALHMRFRMALHFPSLKMMGSNSFMNLMSSPDAVEEALTKVAGGTVDDDF